MDDTQEIKQRKARKRSPGYPMISLEEAIQRAKILWDEDKNNPIPIKAAYEHLGYKSEGGYGGRVLAAMKHFGLIYEKQNDINLTNEAVDLALHDPSDEIYIDTIRKLALNPAIYGKLFNECNGNLPSDATLRVKLIKEYDFNPNKVSGFLSDFRRTIEYANVGEPSIRGDKDKSLGKIDMGTPDKTIIKDIHGKTPPPPVIPGEREVANYPVGKGLKARILISGVAPITVEAIDKLIKLLELNKDDLPENINNERGNLIDQ
jgi:hypothetical protein